MDFYSIYNIRLGTHSERARAMPKPHCDYFLHGVVGDGNIVHERTGVIYTHAIKSEVFQIEARRIGFLPAMHVALV